MFEANPPVGSERCFDKARILPSCRPRRRHAARLQYSTIITRYAKVRQRFARAARKARVQRVAKETIPVKEGHSTISCAAHPLADTGIEDSYLLMHSRRCTSQIVFMTASWVCTREAAVRRVWCSFCSCQPRGGRNLGTLSRIILALLVKIEECIWYIFFVPVF